jgi:hypothetical protein
MYVMVVGIVPSISLIKAGTGALFMLGLADNMNASPA